MLTPQEVAEHAFAKASFGGYNMSMVDEFLDLVTADYTTLYKDNTTLKAKMKVLADKIEEYRTTEEAMRKALVAAQKMADQIVADAEKQKEEILASAKERVGGELSTIRQEVANEQARLAAAKSATTEYISQIKDLCRNQMEYLGSLSKLTVPAAQEDAVSRTVQDAAAAAERQVEKEMPREVEGTPIGESGTLYQELLRTPGRRVIQERTAGPTGAPVGRIDSPDNEPTRRIDFGNLQFGKDYTIK